MRLVPLLACILGITTVEAEPLRPSVGRVAPLGGQQGTTIGLQILGEYLSNAEAVEFDSQDLVWTETVHASSGRLEGTLAIAPGAALGSHRLRVRTSDGYSTTALFNVGQFPDLAEAEPNDRIDQAQEIARMPVEVQAVLEGAADVDIFSFETRTGERWVFDLRSIEHGSAVEAKMFLLDGEGQRVGFNDDRDDYLETPYMDHTFEQGGRYHVKIDQYRGPRGFNFGKNSTYVLRVSKLPSIAYASPLGAAVGTTAEISLHGTGMGTVDRVYLTDLRGAEYARMTYPYTMPVRFGPDPPTGDLVPRVEGRVLRVDAVSVEAQFDIPRDAAAGLWKIWASGSAGTVDGPLIDLGRGREYGESDAPQADWRKGSYAINGTLSEPGEQDVYAIHVVAGKPLHFWTLATQLGVPHLDTVLSLRDSSGRKIAENDDVVAGQGVLLGNPDSSLFHTPSRDGVLFLVVRDRTTRGGPGYQYRLHVRSEQPGFQLFTTPENLSVARGGEAELKVHMVREEGFAGEVAVWTEGLPPEIDAPRGKFRADQLFEPNADGADMIIPELAFRIAVPESLPAGTYPVRVLGAAAAEASDGTRRIVEAGSTLAMGPLLDLWNFVRRPLPRIEITVVEKSEARLTSTQSALALSAGGHASLELQAEGLPAQSDLRVAGLPPGVSFATSREGDRISVTLDALPETVPGSYDISAEARVGQLWAPTGVISLLVKPVSQARSGG